MNKLNFDLCYLLTVQVIVMSLIVSGCATSTRSIGLGGAIGAGTGAVLGGIVDPGKNGEYRTRNVIVGGAIGGMAGMMAGSVIHENTENKKREAFLKGQASVPQSKQGSAPALKTPKVETRWMESKIVGNRFIDGHFEYVIIEPTRWEDSQ